MAAVVQPILVYFGLQNLCIDPTAPAGLCDEFDGDATGRYMITGDNTVDSILIQLGVTAGWCFTWRLTVFVTSDRIWMGQLTVSSHEGGESRL